MSKNGGVEFPKKIEISRLRLKRGDLLIVRSPRRLSTEAAERLAAHVASVLPPLCQVAIFDPGTKLSVIRAVRGRFQEVPVETTKAMPLPAGAAAERVAAAPASKGKNRELYT
jgi:hypothetical protein